MRWGRLSGWNEWKEGGRIWGMDGGMVGRRG